MLMSFLHLKQKKSLQDDLGLFLPEDLEVSLWAESPLFFNPTNMDVDAKGRIWVTEAVNYRNFNNDSTKLLHHTKGDRVIILEDTDHDGKADKSTVFTEDRDLVSPLGIAVIGNKVIVSCAPNLIVYTDDDGDDKPDHKEILLTRFERFGIPVVNAMKAGVAVLTAENSCMAEFTGMAGMFFNEKDPQEIGNKLIRIYNDEQMRSEMIGTGLLR